MMASYSGFLRKAPSGRLRLFLENKGVNLPDDFDWTDEKRGTAFVAQVNNSIDNVPLEPQDQIKADLDLPASLSSDETMVSAAQVCPVLGIDLEGLEGVEDVLLMLALDHPAAFERVAVQASLNKRSGGKNWSAFQFEDDGQEWALDDPSAQTAFVDDVIATLNLPKNRKHDSDWYYAIRTHPITGEKTKILQATIYFEDRAASALAFGATDTLERRVLSRVLEVGIACDPSDHIVEICAAGGKAIRDQYAEAFAKHFAPDSEPPMEAPRRDVLLEMLRSDPELLIEPADGVSRVEVSSLEFFSSGGGFARYELRGDRETIYDFLDRRFGETSPHRASGWKITSATLRVILAPQEGRRSRTLTITLRSPNTTTIPNKTEADREFALSLLDRWQLLAPPPTDAEVEAAA